MFCLEGPDFRCILLEFSRPFPRVLAFSYSISSCSVPVYRPFSSVIMLFQIHYWAGWFLESRFGSVFSLAGCIGSGVLRRPASRFCHAEGCTYIDFVGISLVSLLILNTVSAKARVGSFLNDP